MLVKGSVASLAVLAANKIKRDGKKTPSNASHCVRFDRLKGGECRAMATDGYRASIVRWNEPDYDDESIAGRFFADHKPIGNLAPTFVPAPTCKEAGKLPKKDHVDISAQYFALYESRKAEADKSSVHIVASDGTTHHNLESENLNDEPLFEDFPEIEAAMPNEETIEARRKAGRSFRVNASALAELLIVTAKAADLDLKHMPEVELVFGKKGEALSIVAGFENGHRIHSAIMPVGSYEEKEPESDEGDGEGDDNEPELPGIEPPKLTEGDVEKVGK